MPQTNCRRLENHKVIWRMCKNTLAAGFRGAGPTIRNPLQAAKQRSCGYVRQQYPHKKFRKAGLTHPR